MLNAFFLLPFSYFYRTRLSHGSLLFHALFEWLAAAWLVLWVGVVSASESLQLMLLTYLAFISIYELGYMANDLQAAQKESDGRKRGPQDAAVHWILAWVLARLVCFAVITDLLDQWQQAGWWLFFMTLGAVFTLHNWLEDREMKSATFAWLAWFRFMAPVIFVVEESQRLGIGMAVAMGYVAFRSLGYLDSKGLLRMSGRQRLSFRRFFFLMPLVGVAALWPYREAQGYIWLTVYWALVAFLGTTISEYKAFSQARSR